jgi:hypothetical protein
VVHPAFDGATLENDIGVLYLAERAGDDEIVPLAGADDGPSAGQIVRLAGFGVTQPETNAGPRTKHAGDALVAAVAGTTCELHPDPAEACVGDSGGAAFATSGGEEHLAGVISAGDGACASRTIVTRVDAYRRSFIDGALANAPFSGGCSTAGARAPAGPGFALSLVAALVGARRRRCRPARCAPRA